jgi:hypothetical protein
MDNRSCPIAGVFARSLYDPGLTPCLHAACAKGFADGAAGRSGDSHHRSSSMLAKAYALGYAAGSSPDGERAPAFESGTYDAADTCARVFFDPSRLPDAYVACRAGFHEGCAVEGHSAGLPEWTIVERHAYWVGTLVGRESMRSLKLAGAGARRRQEVA